VNCIYASQCSGCSLIDTPYEEQRESKLKELSKLLSSFSAKSTEEIGFVGFEEAKLRDRVDLSLRLQSGKKVLGLFDKERSEIVDLESCPQMSDDLFDWYQEFRKDLPPVELASIRLRVSPTQKKGVWLDLPNISVKELLEESSWLDRLFSKTPFVEIGQRRKRLVKKEGQWKLGDPVAEDWFETYDLLEDRPIPLYINIGGFSQPGFKANKAMMKIIKSFLADLKIEKALELCAGSGNLSFALASLGIEMTSTELDRNAIQNANTSLINFEKKLPISFSRLNAHRHSKDLEKLFSDKDLVVVDPPRSGLKDSLNSLDEIENKPEYFLYISCFPKSFQEDSERLLKMGYEIAKISILDQFAYSSHYELVALFRQKP
jgi:23S rRNA (uracil1939-C5)-methyltransferase